jgi:hypothetical protein
MRRLAPILIFLGLAALAAVALAQIDRAPAARAAAVAASGSFEVTNSRDGESIFAAIGIAPGGAAEGSVTIEDTGSAAAVLTLHRSELVDAPGVGGGVLSDLLQLSVVDVTVPATPRTVYAGPLASMPDQSVGKLEPGEARTFEFTTTLPAGGTPGVQNAVQGASTTVAYAWMAEEAGEEEGSGGKTPGNGEEVAGGGSPGSSAGGPPGESPPPDGNGAVAGRTAVLDLTVPKLRVALRSGRLVAWTHCDEACRLTVRGRIRATAGGHHRGARVRFATKRFAGAGAQRLRIPIPRGLRRWLRQAPEPKRLRAKLRFVAVGTQGQRDAVRKTVKRRTYRHRRGA